MIYGLYLSATGVITNAYRQDLIANNLANSETVGFKRDLATFYQRPTADHENSTPLGMSNEMLDHLGGGALASPTMIDTTEGPLESTGKPLDLAIDGNGYFTVADSDGTQRLTRDGRFRLDKDGHLTLRTAGNNPVLDAQGNPITLDPTIPTEISRDGEISQGGQVVARLGFLDAADPGQLKKEGGLLISYPKNATLNPANGTIVAGELEDSNVDAATELSDLMETQRELEANANMIHYQDETLGDLVNTVGKVT
ncbi:MAG TPA: flagellar hook-basal body protein [Tepidisphaeraceae bacterium]|nr:flagellar hook-basal body protein [Tepidisphaeraceae bacterium]